MNHLLVHCYHFILWELRDYEGDVNGSGWWRENYLLFSHLEMEITKELISISSFFFFFKPALFQDFS